MRPRALLTFILLNAVVTFGVALLVIQFLGPRDDISGTSSVSTVIYLVVTGTPDPNATLPVRIITATPQPGSVAALPTDLIDDTPGGGAPATAALANTLDPTLVSADPDLQNTVEGLPNGCIPHTLAEGENPSILAEVYGTDIPSILLVNNLTEEDAAFLQIGQVLIIPLEGCTLLETAAANLSVAAATDAAGATPEVTPEVTEAPQTAVPTVTPTLTLPPTAVNAQVEIVEVVSAGDVTAESVILRNNGQTVNLAGWTLSDSQGNVYEFATRNLFGGGEISIFTGAGTDTPPRVYWNRTTAVWGDPGDVVTLRNTAGEVQAVLRLPSPIDLN